ncbi:CBS domain containing protein [Acidimicrobium ferrooxidans DSM 10331]|uniref:CBS domain containing protein n=1 Tax=Acidimicrobium ferrooxidans (strain DSM 10331 / JCM 15462 / NBRC 103882 / ICP) TaxID=525909 RepID=C7LZP2_ACIFD|nr:hemolysin family protein [Acidimicrobium ferrooxidans]ACU54200.1 CBS domain containing protein [Acidimicrobium ferrooxidans DSM 10331]
MSTADWWSLVAVVLLVGVSAILSAAETGLTRTSRVKAQALVDQRRRGARALASLVEAPSTYLSTVLLLTLVSQLIAATLVGVVADHVFGTLGVVVATAVEILVIFVVGEAIPKNVAAVHPEGVALRLAPIVAVLVRFWPIRVLAGGVASLSALLTPWRAPGATVSEAELLAMADAAEQGDVIETDERELIHSVISFGDTIAREVMVPRPDVVAVPAETTVAGAIEVVIEVGRSRLPVYESSLDNVLGIVLAKDLLALEHTGLRDVPVGQHMRPIHFVPETKPVADLLKEMRDGKFHLAVVVDEYGSTAGIVTLEDLIEELVGEIHDEFDAGGEGVVELGEGRWEVRGSVSIDDLSERIGEELPEGEWDSVGGLIMGLLGHLPRVGEEVDVDGVRLQVRQVARHRVASVLVERHPGGLDGS